MSLIEYVEPVSIGSALAGIGSLILVSVMAYIFYRLYIKITQYFDVVINRAAKYEILEEVFLDKIGEKKGVNLNAELIKRRMFEDTSKKSLRRRVEEEIYAEMFDTPKK